MQVNCQKTKKTNEGLFGKNGEVLVIASPGDLMERIIWEDDKEEYYEEHKGVKSEHSLEELIEKLHERGIKFVTPIEKELTGEIWDKMDLGIQDKEREDYSEEEEFTEEEITEEEEEENSTEEKPVEEEKPSGEQEKHPEKKEIHPGEKPSGEQEKHPEKKEIQSVEQEKHPEKKEIHPGEKEKYSGQGHEKIGSHSGKRNFDHQTGREKTRQNELQVSHGEAKKTRYQEENIYKKKEKKEDFDLDMERMYDDLEEFIYMEQYDKSYIHLEKMLRKAQGNRGKKMFLKDL